MAFFFGAYFVKLSDQCHSSEINLEVFFLLKIWSSYSNTRLPDLYKDLATFTCKVIEVFMEEIFMTISSISLWCWSNSAVLLLVELILVKVYFSRKVSISSKQGLLFKSTKYYRWVTCSPLYLKGLSLRFLKRRY